MGAAVHDVAAAEPQQGQVGPAGQRAKVHGPNLGQPWHDRRVDSQTRSYRTGDRDVVLDLTDDCSEYAAGRGDGLLHVFVPHATAGIAILETGAGQRRGPARRPCATCCRPTTGGGTGTAAPGTGART